MFWIAVAAAAQVSAPTGTDLRALFTPDDVPFDVLPAESDRSVGIRMTVRPDGQIQKCEIEFTSGIDRLDVYTCKLAKRRAKFAPAEAKQGIPSYAVYRTTIRWVVTSFAGPQKVNPSADLTLTVNQLPPGVKSPKLLALRFSVDDRGHPSSCALELPRKYQKPEDPSLVQIACEQLLASYKPIPAEDTQGRPVPSVQDALVAFTTK